MIVQLQSKSNFSFSAPTLYWDNLNKCCKWDTSSNMMRLSQTQSETDKRFYFQQMNDTISNKRCSSCLPRFQSPLQFPVILAMSSNCFSSHGWRVFVHTSETFCLSYIFQLVSWVVVVYPFPIFFLVSSCPVFWKSFFLISLILSSLVPHLSPLTLLVLCYWLLCSVLCPRIPNFKSNANS